MKVLDKELKDKIDQFLVAEVGQNEALNMEDCNMPAILEWLIPNISEQIIFI